MKISVEQLTPDDLVRELCARTIDGPSKASIGALLDAGHSPVRGIAFKVDIIGILNFVSVHFVRHKVGVEHYIHSHRDDRWENNEGSTNMVLGMTSDGLNEVFKYEDGKLLHRFDHYKKKKGDWAGTLRSDGRREVSFKGKRALHYRVIYLMHHGYCPPLVGHINGDSSDDRIENLRAATKSQNAMNMKKDGFKGVTARKGKFSSSIHIEGKRIFLGDFESETEAAIEYDKAALRLFGEFASTNFPSSDRPVTRETPVNHTMLCNPESLVTMAHKRLCKNAHHDTRSVMWQIVKACPEWMHPMMIPTCEYRGGFCHEVKSCGMYPRNNNFGWWKDESRKNL